MIIFFDEMSALRELVDSLSDDVAEYVILEGLFRYFTEREYIFILAWSGRMHDPAHPHIVEIDEIKEYEEDDDSGGEWYKGARVAKRLTSIKKIKEHDCLQMFLDFIKDM